MSTTTTNLGLAKPEYSDTADVQEINQNMDKIDSAVGAAQDSFAILADGNTHAAIASGQFVYVRGHATLEDGLYSATAAIPANGALSTSNLAAVPGGGLNALGTSLNRIASGSVDVSGSTSLADLAARIINSGTKVGTGKVGAEDDGKLAILGETIYNYANLRVFCMDAMLLVAFAIPVWGETTVQRKYIFFSSGTPEWKMTAWQTISA